jgi:hypothetical protein
VVPIFGKDDEIKIRRNAIPSQAASHAEIDAPDVFIVGQFACRALAHDAGRQSSILASDAVGPCAGIPARIGANLRASDDLWQ